MVPNKLQEEMNLDNTELERAVEQVDCCCFILSCPLFDCQNSFNSS